VGTSGDCSLDEGTETTTGEDTAVPAGLFVRGGFVAALFLEAAPRPAVSSKWSMAGSLLAPTEAFNLLYRPLKPLCTISKLLTSFAVEAGGGEVRSSKVVKASERDAVACIWWSEPGRAREPRAMVIRGEQLRWGRGSGYGQLERGEGCRGRGLQQSRVAGIRHGQSGSWMMRWS
jgi:hypothetical protein